MHIFLDIQSFLCSLASNKNDNNDDTGETCLPSQNRKPENLRNSSLNSIPALADYFFFSGILPCSSLQFSYWSLEMYRNENLE